MEDCYAALKWVFENNIDLNINKTKIAVGGDSAGGALAAAVCQMARDLNMDLPLFQLLIYPVTDCRIITASYQKYTDTPMWNSKLSKIMWDSYLVDKEVSNIAYASPILASSFKDLPPAYIETAEFDCLHDDGISYAQELQKAGVNVILNETKGTVHGFDIVQNAPTTKNAISSRIKYMQDNF